MKNIANQATLEKTNTRAPEVMTATLNPRQHRHVLAADNSRSSSEQHIDPGLEVTTIPDLAAVKARQKVTWESGDFGQVARTIENVADEFMARQTIPAGAQVLDVACGTGNLAVIAARRGGAVSGIDIAANLIAQAHARAAAEGLRIAYEQGDAEALPYADGQFDLVVSMFGVMFAPRPSIATAEMSRVTRPGGRVAMANWTPEGFIGKMFQVFKAHLPPPPAGVPSPMGWGDAATVRARLRHGFTDVRLTRHIALMRYPFPPAETVEFFRQYYGPTQKAFAALDPAGQAALRRDLVELQSAHNTARTPGTTEVAAEYLEVVAVRE
jgi:2-polyprenyl-3-methyl-5-hydroxy-6-metoxy-1,4-benzoquinol methylase